ncbi:MAG: hypothetical protein ACR2MD_05025 [Aridibacter sp.]
MKYEKIAECPPKLEFWLDLINSVSSEFINNLPDWREIKNEYYLRLSKGIEFGNEITRKQIDIYRDSHSKALTTIKQKTKVFPELYKYVFDSPEVKNDKIERPHERYKLFCHIYKSIYRIAYFCNYERQRINGFPKEIQDTALSSFRLAVNIEIQELIDINYIYFSITSDNKIVLKSELIEVLSGIDANRLRICPICNKPYWAKRLEAPTCSKTCSNNFHQRKLRIKEYEKRLESEVKKLEKLQSNLSPGNSLIYNQDEKVNKLLNKINMEKQKNGNL